MKIDTGTEYKGEKKGTSWAFSFVCLILTSSFYRTSVQRLQEDSTFSSPVTFRTVLKTEVTAKGNITYSEVVCELIALKVLNVLYAHP